MRCSTLLAVLAVAVVLVAAIPSGHAEKASSPSEQLMNARTLRCELGPGTTASWDSKGRLKQELVPEFGKEGVLTFDSLNLGAGTARLVAGGVADVKVIQTHAGLTFIEETGTGNLIFTTVFADARTPYEYRVVSSRHVAMSTPDVHITPLPSQFYGTCKILDLR